MASRENKTKATDRSVDAFIDAQAREAVRDDCRTLMKLMHAVTGEEPRMWGPTMVGYGSCHYKYASGHEGDMFLTGFSPRKPNLTIYLMEGFATDLALMKKLGTCTTSKVCLYVKRLSDIDLDVLEHLVRQSVGSARKTYPG